AARVNDQLESGAPSALSFEPIGVAALRDRWLEHHDQIRRSSVHSIARYRTATDHLLRFLDRHPVRHAGPFSAAHAAEFVRNQRDIPLVPALVDVLRGYLVGQSSGPVFRRRRWRDGRLEFDASSPAALERELGRRLAAADADGGEPDRGARARLARRLWRDIE